MIVIAPPTGQCENEEWPIGPKILSHDQRPDLNRCHLIIKSVPLSKSSQSALSLKAASQSLSLLNWYIFSLSLLKQSPCLSPPPQKKSLPLEPAASKAPIRNFSARGIACVSGYIYSTGSISDAGMGFLTFSKFNYILRVVWSLSIKRFINKTQRFTSDRCLLVGDYINDTDNLFPLEACDLMHLLLLLSKVLCHRWLTWELRSPQQKHFRLGLLNLVLDVSVLSLAWI